MPHIESGLSTTWEEVNTPNLSAFRLSIGGGARQDLGQTSKYRLQEKASRYPKVKTGHMT